VASAVLIEHLLKRDRLIALAGLAMLCALAWLYLLAGAGLGGTAWDMTSVALFPHRTIAAAMPGMSIDPAGWNPARWTLTIAMWWTMMVAMMVPSAAPAVLLYGRVHRHAAASGQTAALAPSWAFAAGYFLAWLGFSIAAALLQWSLERASLLSIATLGSQSRWLSAAVLLAAGLYQLSPLQNACLSHCRSPAAFFARHWRPGFAGAVRLGLLHGGYCVGCCWLLMALLFVAGVMNLVWIAALTLLVTVQKAAPPGWSLGRASGVAMLAWAIATLLV
jgi:predicted metal-binding membrane protein